MTTEGSNLARLQADLNECETQIVLLNLQRKTLGLTNIQAQMLGWLIQRSRDLSVQIQEMETEVSERPTSPAAYRRWVNRYRHTW